MPDQATQIVGLGIITGFVAGLAGVGGAIILVPALVVFFNFSQHQAQGTSLLLLSLPVSAVAAWTYYKEGHVNIPVVGLLALGFLLGGFLGSKAAAALSSVTLQRLFGVLLITLGVRMVFFTKIG
jgi:hypothetical protein